MQLAGKLARAKCTCPRARICVGLGTCYTPPGRGCALVTLDDMLWCDPLGEAWPEGDVIAEVVVLHERDVQAIGLKEIKELLVVARDGEQ